MCPNIHRQNAEFQRVFCHWHHRKNSNSGCSSNSNNKSRNHRFGHSQRIHLHHRHVTTTTTTAGNHQWKTVSPWNSLMTVMNAVRPSLKRKKANIGRQSELAACAKIFSEAIQTGKKLCYLFSNFVNSIFLKTCANSFQNFMMKLIQFCLSWFDIEHRTANMTNVLEYERKLRIALKL